MDWIGIIGVSVLGFFSRVLLTAALKFESAASVALLRQAFDILYAFLFQILLFKVSAANQNILAGYYSVTYITISNRIITI